MKRIPKIPQGEISSIKNILYPDLKPKDNKCKIKNFQNIKILEEKNRKIKEEKQKNIENNIYKINQIKDFPSNQKNREKINLNKDKISIKINIPKTPLNKNNKLSELLKKPSTSDKKEKPYVLPTIKKEEENIYNLLNNKQESMFDKYYSNKSRAKTPSLIKHINDDIKSKNYNYSIKENKYNIDENIYNINNNYNEKTPKTNNISEINNNSSYEYDKMVEEPKIRDSNEIEKLILQYKLKYGTDEALENIIKDYNKNKINENPNNLNCIPEVEEKLESTMKRKNNILLPKIQKNYIRENKKLIIENKIPIKHKNLDDENNNIKHKNFGKVPSYIKRYELERELKKEEIRKQKEAEKLPKGTKLLSEEERISTLNGLINSKKELINQLEKMPITTRTLSIQNKKDELLHKLEELEKGIEMFSKNKVYIQV